MPRNTATIQPGRSRDRCEAREQLTTMAKTARGVTGLQIHRALENEHSRTADESGFRREVAYLMRQEVRRRRPTLLPSRATAETDAARDARNFEVFRIPNDPPYATPASSRRRQSPEFFERDFAAVKGHRLLVHGRATIFGVLLQRRQLTAYLRRGRSLSHDASLFWSSPRRRAGRPPHGGRHLAHKK